MAKKRSDISYERQKLEVIEARARGLSYTAIAKELDIPRSTVWGQVQDVCNDLRDEQYAHADSLRTQMAYRLEKLISVHMPAALSGDMQASDMVLKISRDLSRLFALNVPEQTNMKVDDTLRVEFVGDVPAVETATIEGKKDDDYGYATPITDADAARHDRERQAETPVVERPYDPIFGDN